MISLRIRTFIGVLVAAQVFLSAPVVGAMTTNTATSSTSSTSATNLPCADMMPAMPDGEPCPCCPDGVDNAASCLSACTASLGAIPTHTLPTASTQPGEAFASPPARIATPADPPLKPPPIR